MDIFKKIIKTLEIIIGTIFPSIWNIFKAKKVIAKIKDIWS